MSNPKKYRMGVYHKNNHESELYRFFATAVHDLKAPLASISGFANAILDGTIPHEKQKHYLRIIANEAKRTSELAADIIEISRLEAGHKTLNKTVFDICECIGVVLISLEGAINEKHLTVEFEPQDMCFVLADKNEIHRVIYNLCHNAVKFSNNGGILRINISRKDTKFEIEVFNTGIGIANYELKNVFDKFFKSETASEINKGGSGLGLAIVKSIIDAHDESISVASQIGEYSSFTFTMQKADENYKQELKTNENS